MNSNILSSKSEEVRAIIVEDEDIAINGMKHLLEPYHALIEIVGVSRNGEEAVQSIDHEKPDLVFMDIQIPGLNGLQVLQKVSHKPRVVFTTAFDHHAIEAFELNSVDYLLKPIDPKRFEMTIARLKDFQSSKKAIDEDLIRNLLEGIFPEKTITSITVKLRGKILFIPLHEITHFFANEKYVSLNTLESKQYLVDHTINTLETKLPKEFIRVSRSAIVNRSLIREAKKEFGKKFSIVLRDVKSSAVETGSKYVENFIKGFEL
jgi:two-component system, LytTR family, response regulator